MDRTSVPTSSDRHGWLPGAAILLAALAIRAWDLRRESYWLDELCSIAATQGTWREMLDGLAQRDVHPPLYFALLRGWVRLFGASEPAARSLSVLAGLVAVSSAGRLARELAGRRAEFAAMALVACSPFCVYYSTEARAYSLLLALSLEATLRLVRAARDPRPAPLAVYALLAAALPYTHVFGSFTLAAHGLAVVGARARGHLDARATGRLVVALGVAGLAFLPWVPQQLGQMRRVQEGFWIPGPQLAWWWSSWVRSNDLGSVWSATALVAVGLAAWRWARDRRAGAGLLLACVLVPTAAPIALGALGQPVFLPKYAIAATGALLVVAASTLARHPRALVALCALGLVASWRDLYGARHRADWRALAGFARHEAAREGTALVMTRGRSRELAVYLGRQVAVREVEPGREVTLPRRFWMLNVHPEWTDPRIAPRLWAHWKPVERRAFFHAEAVLWEAGHGSGGELALDDAPKPAPLGATDDAGVGSEASVHCPAPPLRL